MANVPLLIESLAIQFHYDRRIGVQSALHAICPRIVVPFLWHGLDLDSSGQRHYEQAFRARGGSLRFEADSVDSLVHRDRSWTTNRHERKA